MPMFIENGEIPPKLRDVILSKSCVVFIGSGPSSQIYGLWHEVVNKICERCGISRRVDENSEAEEFLDAAQEAKYSGS